MSVVNLAKLKKAAWLDDDHVSSIAVPSPPEDKAKNPITSTIAQQEKEFQKAVQPGSPISALLSSARQPLVMSTNAVKESPLFRKLQAAKDTKSPLRNVRTARGLQDIEEEEDAPRGTREKNHDQHRQKELESQKARIVAQMAPVTTPVEHRPNDDQENMPPMRNDLKGKEPMRGERKEALVQDVHMESPQPKLTGFDGALHTLTLAFDAKTAGKLFRDPRDDTTVPDERVFIVSWVDYCNKYGMGYALTDGSVGVHFNDSTTLILSADKQ